MNSSRPRVGCNFRVPYTITVDTVRSVVRVLVSGILDADQAPAIVTEARRTAGESGLNILYDLRGATPGKLENSDIFWWPRTIPARPGRTRAARSSRARPWSTR